MNYIYSALANSFYPILLRTLYESTGTWPTDGIEVSDEIFNTFSNPPAGKMRVAGANGLPMWEDIPPIVYDLPTRLNRLSVQYKADIQTLNLSYLSATVNDGINEETKWQAVRYQIAARKLQYQNDVAAANLMTLPEV
jgi:hypothetical protein